MYKIIFTLFLNFICSATYAEVFVSYINGAYNSSSAAENAQRVFYDEMAREGVFDMFDAKGRLAKTGLFRKTSYKPIKVIGSGLFDDATEVIFQQGLSERAFVDSNTKTETINNIEYLIKLGKLYTDYNYELQRVVLNTNTVANQIWDNFISKDHKLIFVAHSQGNLYLEAAIAILISDPEKREKVLSNVKVLSLGSVAATTFNGLYINLSQDNLIWGWGNTNPGTKFKPMNANYQGCVYYCTKTPLSASDIEDKLGTTAHSFATHLNRNLFILDINKKVIVDSPDYRNGTSITKVIADTIIKAANLNIRRIDVSKTPHIASNSFINKLLGINNAYAQSTPTTPIIDLGSTFYVKVEGDGLGNYGFVEVEDATCDENTIQRGVGFFTQQCKSGSNAGSKRLQVKTVYGAPIAVPYGYREIVFNSPIIAPNEPTLQSIGNSGVRATWNPVAGASFYELFRGQTRVAGLSSPTSFDDKNLTPGSTVCYRVRTVIGNLASSYSPEACITLPTSAICSGQWTVGTFFGIDQTETSRRSCGVGYTGYSELSHTCLVNGSWGTISTANNCIATPVPGCQGSWSSIRYSVGQVEEKFENACPAGTTGQVRSFHTCLASNSWSATANSDNCTSYLASPTDVQVSNVSGGIQITWAAVSGATSYKLYKHNTSSVYREITNATSFVDSYVSVGSTYKYAVAAYSNLNNQSVTSPVSAWSATIVHDIGTGINPPTNVQAAQYTQYSQKGIRLSWVGAPAADSYLIYRRGYSNPYTSAAFLAPVYGSDISFNDWVNAGFAGSIVSGQSYCYYIRAVRGNANSIESNEACSMAP